MPGLSSGWSLEAVGNRRPRQMATIRLGRIQNSAYRPTGIAIEPFRPRGGGSLSFWLPIGPYRSQRLAAAI